MNDEIYEDLQNFTRLLRSLGQINIRHLPALLKKETVQCNTLFRVALTEGYCGYDENTKTIYVKSSKKFVFDDALCKAIDVVCFLSQNNQIEIFSLEESERPDVLFFSLDCFSFDIVFYPKSREDEFNQIFKSLNLDNCILILDDSSKIKQYKCDSFKYYCHVNTNGEVHFID